MTNLPHMTDILLTQDRSTLMVTLNRPHIKNALSAAMVESLIALCDHLTRAGDIRAVVVRGAGGAFCGGGDIKEFGKQVMTPDPAQGEPDPVAKSNRVFGDLLLKMDALPQALVCVVEGPAFGGANGVISVSDMVIAEENAQFSLSETTLGIPPAQIGPFLVRRIGLFNARRLAMTGARFSAEEALRLGLVDKIANGVEGIDAVLMETLNAIGRCEPLANAATKEILNRAGGSVDPSQLDAASESFAACLRGKGRKGATAFANKNPAPWVETYSVKKET